MLRRLATSVALTAALVLGASVSASAHHAEPDATFEGKVRTCKNLDEVDSYWERSAKPPTEIKHSWWRVQFNDRALTDFDVRLTDAGKSGDARLAVLVYGMHGGTNLFLNEPGEHLNGLFAPAKQGKDHPKIKKYTICKVEKKPEPDPDPPETPKPEPSETPKPEPSETPKPEPSETPVPVPTEVPAGSGSSASPGAIVGLLAAVTVALTGLSVAVRRRFLHES